MKITSHLCKTMNLGAGGNLFGGQLMYWLDEAAAIYAFWATGERKIVTRRISEALFHKPIRQDEILEFHCLNPHKGNTSFSFITQVQVNGEIRFQAECTFVAVDDHGQKKKIDWTRSPVPSGEWI